MTKKKKKGFAKKGSIGYILVGTFVVILMLCCIIALSSMFAPTVLSIHVGDAPAMMTMPIFIYCVFADLILLEVIFLLFQPGAKEYIEDDKPTAATEKKKVSGQVIIGIVCAVLLLCSIIIGPNVCNVFTEDGVTSYVFFKTDEVAWEDVGFYELEFTQEKGLSLLIHITKDHSIPLFGGDNFQNPAFKEKYTDEYGFAGYLKEQAAKSDKTFKVVNPEAIEKYFKDTPYWESIEELIK